jgi:hypothetical protein
VEGDRCFFSGVWLGIFPVVSVGFSALIHISLTVTSLPLTCRFQNSVLPSTSCVFQQFRQFNRKVWCFIVLVELCSLISSIH